MVVRRGSTVLTTIICLSFQGFHSLAAKIFETLSSKVCLVFMKACERAAVKEQTFSGVQFFVNMERSDDRKYVCVRRLVHPQKSSIPESVEASI